jgi:hypothetical protein
MQCKIYAYPELHSLSVLCAQQAEHLRSGKRDIRDGGSRVRDGTRVVEEFDLPRAAAGDFQHSTARVLRLSDNGHHSIHNLLHGNPLAPIHPALTRSPERSQNAARGDCDDSYAFGWFHGRHGFDKVVDGCFGGGVERDCGSRLLGGGGADHYYRSAGVEASESVEGELGAADWVVKVDFEDFVAGCRSVCAGFECPEGGFGLERKSACLREKRATCRSHMFSFLSCIARL